MIRVKNNGRVSIRTGGTDFQPEYNEVFEGFILPTYLEEGKVAYQIKFTGDNPKWHEPILVSEAVEAIPESEGVEAVAAKESVYQHSPENKLSPYGYFFVSQFIHEHNSNVLLAAHEHALTVFGTQWEIDL